VTETYPIVEVHPSELYPAPYQPASRTEQNNALNALKSSISNEGLQYPPLVVRKPDGDGYTIIDGHRRVKVAQNLRWPKIPVIVSSQGDARKLFAAVSGASKPLSAVEWIEVYLGGGDLPPGPNASCIRRLDEVMGREYLHELKEKRLSPQIWNLASRLIKYMGVSEEEKPSVLRWLAKHKLTRQASSAIQGDVPPAQIAAAFREDSSRL
jgi:hypothetical protein